MMNKVLKSKESFVANGGFGPYVAVTLTYKGQETLIQVYGGDPYEGEDPYTGEVVLRRGEAEWENLRGVGVPLGELLRGLRIAISESRRVGMKRFICIPLEDERISTRYRVYRRYGFRPLPDGTMEYL